MHHDLAVPAARNVPGIEEKRGHFRAAVPRYHYSTYGLVLSSQFELPELRGTEPTPTPDIEILADSFPEDPNKPGVGDIDRQGSADCSQFVFEGVARYRIEQGKRILIDRRVLKTRGTGTPERDLRGHLLGSAMGTLLHQKHWLPLHLSALETPDGIWGFTGAPGAGTSTLAAWLHYHHDWPLLTDEVGVIKPDEALPYLHPGPPRLKLWKDALASLGFDHHSLSRDLTRSGKYHLIRRRGFHTYAQPLRALVLLEHAEKGTAASLEPLEGLEALEVVMASLYLPEWGQALNGPARLRTYASELAQRIQVYRYRRPWTLDDMEQSLAPLVQRIHERASHDAT
ncbi:hypothetical protein M8009_03680 [Halomonas sp. ATCH28]|uniref:Uncharacterized protein n=1 Tax=Halomonas gemina TaxID=2945105 RepID=A0ABT0SXM0_9GAMM|nr:hypothetical protein [Halomonas gemina]MCL7939405.1 hypothetical protein [Halomonas gemina]